MHPDDLHAIQVHCEWCEKHLEASRYIPTGLDSTALLRQANADRRRLLEYVTRLKTYIATLELHLAEHENRAHHEESDPP